MGKIWRRYGGDLAEASGRYRGGIGEVQGRYRGAHLDLMDLVEGEDEDAQLGQLLEALDLADVVAVQVEHLEGPHDQLAEVDAARRRVGAQELLRDPVHLDRVTGSLD